MLSAPSSPSATPFEPPLTAATDRVIQPARGAALAVRLHGRRRSGQTVPLVLHFHGGAFVKGNLDSSAAVAGLLAEAGAIVLSIDYPLAPAHPFPAALEAGQAALDWAWKHRGKLAGPGAPVWVAGEEAGGNLATSLALMARDRQHPPLAGQILLSPMLNPCVATASLRKAAAGPVGCRYADGWHAYLARTEDCTHPYAAPASALRLADLPRTLIVSAHDDPMRDEAQAYAARLREAGVSVDEALLPAPTGWPSSLMQAGTPGVASEDDASRPGAAPWAEALRERLRRFLSEDPARSRPDPANAVRA